MRKGPQRSLIKVGGVSTDWSGSVLDQRGYPAMGGAGWARLGQVKDRSFNHWVVGRILPLRTGIIGVQTWDNNIHSDCRIVVMQRHMTNADLLAVQRARANGQIIINDLDDWFWGLHQKNAARRITDPKINSASNIDHYKKVLLASSLITVSTQFLSDRLREWSDDLRIEVVHNGVNLKDFPKHRHTSKRCVIGWAGSTAHRSGDLEILRKPFANLKTAHFHHTGANPMFPNFATEVGIAREQLTVTPMLAPHEYPYGLTFDIGVIPLVDIPFNHAKSNIKGLEYAAAGIPFIASPLPEYVRLAEEYGIGRLAKTTKDWNRQIAALMDHEVRSEEAARQRAALTAHHLDAKNQARQWDELLWSL